MSARARNRTLQQLWAMFTALGYMAFLVAKRPSWGWAIGGTYILLAFAFFVADSVPLLIRLRNLTK